MFGVELKEIPEDATNVLRPTPRGTHVPDGIHLSMKLQGRVGPKKVYNLETLANYYPLLDKNHFSKARLPSSYRCM